MDGCVFCDIALGRVTAHIIHQDELVVAFLDTHPIRPGHTQIVSHAHVACFDDLPSATAARIVAVGQQVAKALKRFSAVPRVAFLFTGGDVPHAHAHLVPMHETTDITSCRYIAEERLTFRPVSRAPERELAGVADRLKLLAADGPEGD